MSLFAVFDGHGGFEVSKYSALRLPDHIKSDLGYKHGDYKEALEEAFMSFDKSLRTPEVIKELNNILDNKPMDGAHGFYLNS
jgi:protein phosphatase 1G